MRENREKGGNTDTSAGWKNFWVASGLSTEAEGSCQPGGRLRIHVGGSQDSREHPPVTIPRCCHHPTLAPSRAVSIPHPTPLFPTCSLC